MPGEYICGGYYLTHLSQRADYMSPELIPDRVLSASGCISDFFPDTWTIDWTGDEAGERVKAAARFGISHSELPGVIGWATRAFSEAFGWPSAFYTLRAAQQARAGVLLHDPDVVVFGLGLQRSLVDDFLAAAKPPEQQPGFAPVGESGVFQCVKSGSEIAGGGHPAGFEPLATDSGLITCSWLCNGLERECAKQIGVPTNRSGLVEAYADALRCTGYISREDVGAEPGLWLPWLLTVYPA